MESIFFTATQQHHSRFKQCLYDRWFLKLVCTRPTKEYATWSYLPIWYIFCWESVLEFSKKMIKDSLPGADFIESRSCCALSMNSFWYTLQCNRYKCLEIGNQKEYPAESYTQSRVCHKSVKRTKTSCALWRIDAMATKTELRAMKNQTITTNSKVHRKKWMYPTKRCTKSKRTKSSSNKCNCQISILL